MDDRVKTADLFTQWGDYQKTFMSQWVEACQQFPVAWPLSSQSWADKGSFLSLGPIAQWTQMLQDTLGKGGEESEGKGGPGESVRSILDGNPNAIFGELWSAVLKDLPELYQATDDPGKTREIYGRWSAQNLKTMERLFGAAFPQSDQEIMKSWLNIVHMGQPIAGLMWTPWSQAIPQWQRLAERFTTGDWEALSEALRLWRSVYDETLGRVFRMPAFGLNKVQVERVNKTYDAFVQFWSSLPGYNVFFYKTGIEALLNALEEIEKLRFGEAKPEQLREIYRVWWTTNEKSFLELFKSPEFGGAMSEVLNYGLRLKKRVDELAAEGCKSLSIPSYRDFDEMAQAIQDLRRRVHQQQHLIEELQQELASAV